MFTSPKHLGGHLLVLRVEGRHGELTVAQLKKVGENIDFQKQLNALSPVPEFLALEKVVAGKVA